MYYFSVCIDRALTGAYLSSIDDISVCNSTTSEQLWDSNSPIFFPFIWLWRFALTTCSYYWSYINLLNSHHIVLQTKSQNYLLQPISNSILSSGKNTNSIWTDCKNCHIISIWCYAFTYWGFLLSVFIINKVFSYLFDVICLSILWTL